MNGFSSQERRKASLIIFANLLDAFKILLDIMATEHIKFGSEYAKVIASVQPFDVSLSLLTGLFVQLSANLITHKDPTSLFDETPLDTATGAAMKDLWQDSGVQSAISWSRNLPFYDNML